MKHTFVRICTLLVFSILLHLGNAQVRRPRTSGLAARQVRKPAAALAPADSEGRRQAIVVLSDHSVVEHIVANTPTVTDVRGVRRVDTATVRRRVFSDEGDQYALTLRSSK